MDSRRGNPGGHSMVEPPGGAQQVEPMVQTGPELGPLRLWHSGTYFCI